MNNKKDYYHCFKLCLENDFDNLLDFSKHISSYNLTNKDKEDIYVLATATKINRKKAMIDKAQLSDVLFYYNNILNNTIKLSQELDLSNSLEISVLYTHLLDNGFFSKNINFKHQAKGRNNIPGLYSLDIMSGIGVCLNVSDMLKDLLNIAGFDSAIISNNYIYKSIPNILWSNMPTHAFNIIKEDGKMYIYDSTNSELSRIKSVYRSEIIASKNPKYRILYNNKLYPYKAYFININEKEIKLLDEFIKKQNFNSPYTKNDYTDALQKCETKININEYLIYDFWFSIQNYIDNIDVEIRLRKKFKH